MGDIVDESRGTLRFTDDPDEADILVSVRMKYLYSGKYSGAGITVSVPSTVSTETKCSVTSSSQTLRMRYPVTRFGLLPASVWLPSTVYSRVKSAGRPRTAAVGRSRGSPS